MKTNRWKQLLILTELSLILLPLGLLFFSDLLNISKDEFFWIMLSCIFSTAVCILSLFFSRKEIHSQDPDLIKGFFFLVPVLQYGFILTLVLLYKNPEIHAGSFFSIFLGLMFILLGNLLPKSSPNPVFGVRTKWTLANRENWRRTSQITGRLWVIGGLLCWASVFFRFYFYWVLIVILALAPVLISWLIYRQQGKEGTWCIDTEENSESVRLSRPLKAFCLLLLAATAAFCIWIIAAGKNYSVHLDGNRLYIEALIVPDQTVFLDDTQSLVLKPAESPGHRVFGYSAFGIDLGNYENDSYGSYTRYTSNTKTVIELCHNDETLVLSLPTDDETRKLFDEIAEKIRKDNVHCRIADEVDEASSVSYTVNVYKTRSYRIIRYSITKNPAGQSCRIFDSALSGRL